MNKLRIVIDTNIFISGLLLSASNAQQVFDLVTESQILLMSDSTFTEICQTLICPKFDKYISLLDSPN